jgi:hypothetical protein
MLTCKRVTCFQVAYFIFIFKEKRKKKKKKKKIPDVNQKTRVANY